VRQGLYMSPLGKRTANPTSTREGLYHPRTERPYLCRLLRAAGYEVASYDSAQQLLEHLPQDDRPSCILLDVQIPSLSRPELQNRLSAAGSLVPIVFLTGHGDIPTSVQAIKAGAEDFLTKPVSKEVLLSAIERAVARYLVVRRQHDQLDALRARFVELTPRERQVFGLVVRGRPNKQIADELGIGRTNRQGASAESDGKDQSSNAGGARFDRGTSRHAGIERGAVREMIRSLPSLPGAALRHRVDAMRAPLWLRPVRD
jgi:FixJ family two-component response regulator